jgi:hypothetical protein
VLGGPLDLALNTFEAVYEQILRVPSDTVNGKKAQIMDMHSAILDGHP